MKIRRARLDDAQGVARVHISSWRTTYRGIVPDEYLSNLDVEERVVRWQKILASGTSNTLVAVNSEGKIMGFINGGARRTGNYNYDGELYAIYLLKECQRQGLGKKLIREFAEILKEQHYNNMLIWVLKDNPGRHFYETFNPEKVDEKTIAIGGVNLTEVAYGLSLGALYS